MIPAIRPLLTPQAPKHSGHIGKLDERHIWGTDHVPAVSIGLTAPIPSKFTLCLCGARADNFRGTGAFLLRQTNPQQAEKMNGCGISANTVIHRHANTHKALRYAMRTGLLDYSPADRVERPKKRSLPGAFITRRSWSSFSR